MLLRKPPDHASARHAEASRPYSVLEAVRLCSRHLCSTQVSLLEATSNLATMLCAQGSRAPPRDCSVQGFSSLLCKSRFDAPCSRQCASLATMICVVTVCLRAHFFHVVRPPWTLAPCLDCAFQFKPLFYKSCNGCLCDRSFPRP